jgi:sugar/nucleoside kinase (ribokinase family)
MPRYDVIVVGGYFVDLIFNGLPQFPVLGKEIVGSGFEMVPGGAYNAALAMHRLGLKVGWAADFGDDNFSRFALERARAEGLDDALFVHHRRPLRHITVALSYPEERSFITYNDPEPGTPAALKALVAGSARVLFISGVYYGNLHHAGSALVRAKRMKVFMDGNSGDEVTLANPAVRRSLQSVDAFLPNAAEARRLAGKADLGEAMAALAALCPLVIVKDGANGSYARTGGQTLHAPGIPVTSVDTTGAGDCFSAGFLKAWFDDRPLAECLRWGNVVGGLSTTALGGTGRPVTTADVERLLYGSVPNGPRPDWSA